MDEITIPDGGAYFRTETGRFHIAIEGDEIRVRCIDVGNMGTPRLFTHMPSGNVVLIQGEREA